MTRQSDRGTHSQGEDRVHIDRQTGWTHGQADRVDTLTGRKGDTLTGRQIG